MTLSIDKLFVVELDGKSKSECFGTINSSATIAKVTDEDSKKHGTVNGME